MKKRIILLCAAVILVAATIVGGSLAAISATGALATNEMNAAALAVNVEKTYTLNTEDLMPGDTVDSALTDFKITNTADTAAYIRVTVKKYWLTEDTASENGDYEKNSELNTSYISLSESSGNYLRAEGGMQSSSNETDVLYLKAPCMPGEEIALPLNLSIDGIADDSYKGARIELAVSVDAVQFVAGENELNESGILSAFGTVAELSADGSILSLAE